MGADFTFSGKYREGPNYTGEVIGDLKTGTDVHKESGYRALVATGAMDKPDARKVHKKPIARIGGLAIYAPIEIIRRKKDPFRL